MKNKGLKELILFCIILVFAGCTQIDQYYQQYADKIRLNNMNKLSKLLDEFKATKGHPLYYVAKKEDFDELRSSGVTLLTNDQYRSFYIFRHKNHKVMPDHYEEFKEILEEGLGRQIDLPVDPQKTPNDLCPRGYIYWSDGKSYVLQTFLGTPHENAYRAGDFCYPYKIFSGDPSWKALMEAYQLVESGKNAEAIEKFIDAIERQPDAWGVYSGLGMAYAREGKFDLALEKINKAMELDSNATIYRDRGIVYLYKGDLDQAIPDLNKAIAMDSTLIDAYYQRGTAYVRLQDWDKAISDFTKVIELNPNHVDAYFDRGSAYIKKEQFDLAFSDFNKVIQLKPDYVDAYYNRALIYELNRDDKRALEDYNKVISVTPQDSTAYYRRALLYDRGGKSNQAISDLNHAIQINPSFAIAYDNLGFIYSKRMEYDKAINEHNKAIEIDSSQPNYYVNRANALLGKGKFDEAIADWTRAIELDANLATAYYNRAMIYLMKKSQIEEAKRDILKAKELGYPIPPQILTLLEVAATKSSA